MLSTWKCKSMEHCGYLFLATLYIFKHANAFFISSYVNRSLQMLHLRPLMCGTESENTERKFWIISCWNIIIEITFTNTRLYSRWQAQLLYLLLFFFFLIFHEFILHALNVTSRWRSTMILHSKPTSQSVSGYITWSFYGSYARCLY